MFDFSLSLVCAGDKQRQHREAICHWSGQTNSTDFGDCFPNFAQFAPLACESQASAEAGAVVVVTDPKDDRARAFYEPFGFESLDERRLFIPMTDLLEREARGWTA